MRSRTALGLLSAIPLFLLSWVSLIGVEQPQRVEPQQSFEVVVAAQVLQDGWPLPMETIPEDGVAPEDAAVRAAGAALRLGVLLPDGWTLDGVTWSTAWDAGELDRAPQEELWTYHGLRAAPADYHWEAFGPADTRVSQGDLKFSVSLTAGSGGGRFELTYATWDEPLYGAGLEYVSPRSSLLSASIDVGEVGPSPRVTAFDPPDGSANVAVDADLGAVFSRNMNVQSLRSGGILLYQGPVYFASGGAEWDLDAADSLPGAPSWMPPWPQPQPVATEVFWSPQEKRAIVFPLQQLLPHTIYTLVVTPQALAEDGVPVEFSHGSTFLTAPGPLSPLFRDVPLDHRFNQAIETLVRAGIAEGYPDGSFRPDQAVTRLQLAVMMVNLLGLHTPQPDPWTPYRDLPTGDSADPALDYVGEATRAGVVMGFEDGTFRPQDPVTRIQMVRMIVRASQSWLQAPPPEYNPGFGDVAPADLSYVSWAAYNHLVDGKAVGIFDPWSEATRGHAARVLYGVWRMLPQPLDALR